MSNIHDYIRLHQSLEITPSGYTGGDADLTIHASIDETEDSRFFISVMNTPPEFIKTLAKAQKASVLIHAQQKNITFQGPITFDLNKKGYWIPIPKEGEYEIQERRQFYRAKVSRPVQVTLQKMDKLLTYDMESVDLSGGGMLLYSPVAFSKGEIFSMKFQLEASNREIATAAVVTLCRRNTRDNLARFPYLVGIKFQNLPPACEDIIMKECFTAQLKAKRIGEIV